MEEGLPAKRGGGGCQGGARAGRGIGGWRGADQPSRRDIAFSLCATLVRDSCWRSFDCGAGFLFFFFSRGTEHILLHRHPRRLHHRTATSWAIMLSYTDRWRCHRHEKTRNARKRGLLSGWKDGKNRSQESYTTKNKNSSRQCERHCTVGEAVPHPPPVHARGPASSTRPCARTKLVTNLSGVRKIGCN